MKIKKTIAIIAAMCLLLCCAGCGADENTGGMSSGEKETAVLAMKNPLTIGEITLDLPEDCVIDLGDDFSTESGKLPTVYTNQFPERTDNINFNVTGQQQNPEFYTAAAIEEIIGSMLDDFSGVTYYEQTECCGYTALKVKYTFTVDGKLLRQTQFYIFTNNDMYLITFTAEDEQFEQKFDQSIQSIVI